MESTSTSPVVVVATFTPTDGREQEVESALREAVPRVHGEPGCDLFAVHRARSGALVVVEKYESTAALRSHGAGPAFAELSKNVDGLLDGEIDVQVLRPVPIGESAKGAL